MDIRILIIDDNPEIHKDFNRILISSTSQNNQISEYEEKLFEKKNISAEPLPKFTIDSAAQGEEGIKMVTDAVKEKKPYALAFIDVRMPPGLDGIETTKRIWKIDKNIQVVICTAYSDYTWEETIEHLGQKENLLILKKPFDNVAVRQLSCALTKKWQLMLETHEYTKSLEKKVEERTHSLQESLSISRGTLESSAEGILVENNEHKIIDYNNNLIKIWKIPESILESKNASLLLEYISQQITESKRFLNIINDLRSCPDTVVQDKLKCNDNRIFEHYSQPYKLNNIISGRIWCFRNITERAVLEEKLQYQATHDALTGLPNRLLFKDRLDQMIAHAKRSPCQFAVLFFDIDHFKLINDSLSHAAGDELLCAITARLVPQIREEDTLARLGGDEFVLLARTFHEKDNFAKIAQNILNAFHEPFQAQNQKISLTASIGIAIYPEDGQKSDELLRNSDSAMYLSKEMGGGQFQFYTNDLGNKNLERLKLESELRNAIEKEEFIINYQPLFSLYNNKVFSCEALIRWQHPTKGILLPVEFILLAEKTGLIIPITKWILKTVCAQNKYWQDQGFPKIKVAVNITNKVLNQPNFVAKITRILKESGLSPEYLELELTENVIIDNLESLNIIAELRKIGVQIALDDFGSGYASLNYLRKLPLDRLKIDHTFIDKIGSSQGEEIIIKAIIEMAKNLNLEVTAEGVESKLQVDFLKKNRCNEIQGFYFSKPLSKDEFENFLKNLPL